MKRKTPIGNVSLTEAAEMSWAEKFRGKPVTPLYAGRHFINANIDGAWPVDIFLAGFYAGAKFAEKGRAKYEKRNWLLRKNRQRLNL